MAIVKKITKDHPIPDKDIALIRSAYKAAFGREAGDNIRVSNDNLTVEIDCITMSLVDHDVESAMLSGGTETVTRTDYLLEGATYYPSTMWEPEDIDLYEISHHSCLSDAIGAAFAIIVKMVATEHISVEMYAREVREEIELPF